MYGVSHRELQELEDLKDNRVKGFIHAKITQSI